MGIRKAQLDRMKVFILIAVCLAALSSCTQGGAAFLFYVVTKPDEATKFLEAVTAIAKEDGLETAMGQTVFDTGDVLRVVEGRGHGLKLWVQSAPLSGHENPKLCGTYLKPHPDPAQFIVFTEPRFLGSRVAATELGARVLSQLRNAGFDVRREPPVCGAAALHERA
jgi:hypothetical protein